MSCSGDGTVGGLRRSSRRGVTRELDGIPPRRGRSVAAAVAVAVAVEQEPDAVVAPRPGTTREGGTQLLA